MADLTIGSLFSGIGGLELGLERAGLGHTAWQSEITPFSSRVLAAHWPDAPNLGDITKIRWADVAPVDVMCGGFPCQDISTAHTNGNRKGLDGDKSGLWIFYRYGIQRIRPRFVIVENVAQWRDWVPTVRADLADLGYASVPVVLHAGSFGAPHRRARCFVVADADRDSESLGTLHAETSRLSPVPIRSGSWGQSEPDHFRVDDGVSGRVDRRARLRALGNAVVPAVAEHIGRTLVRFA